VPDNAAVVAQLRNGLRLGRAVKRNDGQAP
jgi:hypothetical protein